MNIRLERKKLRIKELKKQLEFLFYNQPNGVYQRLEWQHDLYELNKKIRLIENSIKKQIN